MNDAIREHQSFATQWYIPKIKLLKTEERARAHSGLMTLVFIIVIGSLMTVGYTRTLRVAHLSIDGQKLSLHTHQRTIGGSLREVGITLRVEDIVYPPLDTALASDMKITIDKAQPVRIKVNDSVIEHYTHAQSVQAVLREVDLAVDEHDLITARGNPHDYYLAPDSPLPTLNTTSESYNPATLNLAIKRAVPVHIHDDGATNTIYSVYDTLGETMLANDITLYLGDQLSPDWDSSISKDLHIYVHRSKPVTVMDGSRVIKTRTNQETVRQLLTKEGIELRDKDYAEPYLDGPVTDNMLINLVRVQEEILLEEEPIKYETVFRPDSSIEIDDQRLDQSGRPGVTKRRFRVVYENGEPNVPAKDDEWTARPPTTEIVAYGTNIVERVLHTPEGDFRYWRKMRMLITSYTAATCGKTRDHPEYGITFLGWQVQRGHIAVDPNVISLRSEMYVPGYGHGIAADTGGKIKGMHIDLNYDEDDFQMWYRWEDVYLLSPPPSPDQIRWILPSWPRER